MQGAESWCGVRQIWSSHTIHDDIPGFIPSGMFAENKVVKGFQFVVVLLGAGRALE